MVIKPDEAAALLEFGGFAAPSAVVVLQVTFGLSGAKSCGVIAVQGTSALEVVVALYLELLHCLLA